MAADKQKIQRCLKSFDFTHLFIEELGWDYTKELPLSITVKGQTYTLRPLAHKRDFKVYVCDPNLQGRIPEDAHLRLIDREMTAFAYEHIIIYGDAAKEQQVWQWVKREQGKPLAPRTNRLAKGQSGDLLAQKLVHLAFDLQEEESLTNPVVSGRVRNAFDVERVTKRFFERFQVEHKKFMGFIEGITAQGDREWYTSIMLNRLMFVYFIQRQGFLNTTSDNKLNGDPNYLRNHLKLTQEQHGPDTFHSFYRYFLLRLFHEGLSIHQSERTPELDRLLGKIPYLNGGLFDVHQLEHEHPAIQIADEAFERIFDFFDEFDWHLDDRPNKAGNEINPDVLGYIFEKYINQKQMGAYYTKEDITEYISKNTIIPYLFESAREKCIIAFEPQGQVWSLLRDNPDEYIYEAVAKGTLLPLPPEIEVGLHAVAQRSEWNKAAPDEYALPTETWREVVARRTRHEEVRAKLMAGEITSINDLITYNLNIRAFALDVISNCEGPELLQAFYNSIATMTVLDPTCGSGAFLFAALNILEPLYEACLGRMQKLVTERDSLDAQLEPMKRRKYPRIDSFRAILKEVEKHPNRAYFILKSIIINNLFGVDIMEEATEICKLRLFLKLVSQVTRYSEIEPLPDIDFNIRAGNTLVGFSTLEEVRAVVTKDLRSAMTAGSILEEIEYKAKEIERDYKNFRRIQTSLTLEPMTLSAAKQQLRQKLSDQNATLDRYLAVEYNIDQHNLNASDYCTKLYLWQKSHQPFHWYVQFYEIMQSGGFDVIIGNPPYVDLKDFKGYGLKGFATIATRNLYSLILERCKQTISHQGYQGYIVPVSSISTEGYLSLQQVLRNYRMFFSSYDDRPAHLFDGLDKNTLSILILAPNIPRFCATSTRLSRWSAEERSILFTKLQYEATPELTLKGAFPKIGSSVESKIWHKVFYQNSPLVSFCTPKPGITAYYSRKVNAFLQALDFVPEVRDGTGKLRSPSEFKELIFSTQAAADAAFCCLNSTLFRWFLDVVSDGSHLNRREVDNFPFNPIKVSSEYPELQELARHLSKNLQRTSTYKIMRYKHDTLTVQCIIPKYSKSIIDEIDRVLARHYGFTDEELDFIINYDIKYRMWRDSGEEDEE